VYNSSLKLTVERFFRKHSPQLVVPFLERTVSQYCSALDLIRRFSASPLAGSARMAVAAKVRCDAALAVIAVSVRNVDRFIGKCAALNGPLDFQGDRSNSR
jgi:hypothetical protein